MEVICFISVIGIFMSLVCLFFHLQTVNTRHFFTLGVTSTGNIMFNNCSVGYIYRYAEEKESP